MTADELRDCRDQIAHFKVPYYLLVVDRLPRTVTGKVRKHVLRDEGIAHSVSNRLTPCRQA